MELRPVIAPISGGGPRPLWSVMVPTYNSAGTLEETLSSVLRQDPGQEFMQIEVVDDCSTDASLAIVQRVGGGRIAYYRHSENLGHVQTFNDCLRRSRGHFVHVLHSDDYVREGFYELLQCAFDHHPEVGAAFVRHIYMDERGHWQTLSLLEREESGIIDDWLVRIASGQRIAAPSVAVRREVYERVGGFDPRFSSTGEDWEMWVRIAANTKVWFETEPLAVYRIRRGGSLSDGALRTSRFVADMRKAVEILETWLPDYLPPSQAQGLLQQARSMYAGWAIEGIEASIAAGRMRQAVEHLHEALKCRTSPRVVAGALVALVKALGRGHRGRL